VENVLEKIVAYKLGEIEQAKSAVPEETLREQLAAAPEVRPFRQALLSAPEIGLIAEVKKASPSAGLIREDFDPVEIAKIYEAHGASCISVLTDEHFFQGNLSYLSEIRQNVELPVLRKDFILDRYQLLEARAAGADCVLLIAECLDDSQLRDLHTFAGELGLETLIEFYDPDNFSRVLELEPKLLGINNRDLKTFVTDLNHTIRFVDQIPADCLLVSESGIKTREDVVRLKQTGVGALLVGETLMRPANIGNKVNELLGTTSEQ